MGKEIPPVMQEWIDNYKQQNGNLLARNPEFARWLERHYRPIAGGWLY